MIKPTPKNQDGKLLKASGNADVLLLFTEYKGKEVAAIFQKERLYKIYTKGEGLPLGSICIGKVSEIRPEIGAAFLLLAGKQKCFIHLSELTPGRNLRRPGAEVKCGDDYVVRITKEPAKGKLASATAKLKEEENSYFETAKNRTDFYVLSQKDYICNAIKGMTDLVNMMAEKDVLMDSFERDFESGLTPSVRIITDSESTHNRIKELLNEEHEYEYLNSLLTEDSPMLYRDELVSVSVLFRLGAQLEEALSKRVWLKSGAFLVIEYTEAMTVVDVNSGKCEKHSGDDFILEINKEAGEEIIRQAVLRNLSGIIVIDFINLRDKNSQNELLAFMQNAVGFYDPEIKIAGFTKLGLAEMTRKKNGKPLFEQF